MPVYIVQTVVNFIFSGNIPTSTNKENWKKAACAVLAQVGLKGS